MCKLHLSPPVRFAALAPEPEDLKQRGAAKAQQLSKPEVCEGQNRPGGEKPHSLFQGLSRHVTADGYGRSQSTACVWQTRRAHKAAHGQQESMTKRHAKRSVAGPGSSNEGRRIQPGKKLTGVNRDQQVREHVAANRGCCPGYEKSIERARLGRDHKHTDKPP